MSIQLSVIRSTRTKTDYDAPNRHIYIEKVLTFPLIYNFVCFRRVREARPKGPDESKVSPVVSGGHILNALEPSWAMALNRPLL